MLKKICAVYRCSKKSGMYLYVDKQEEFTRVPEGLLKQVGKTELAMVLALTEDKKLAHANAADVLLAISEKGFYLQMPPSYQSPSDGMMHDICKKNHKL